MFLNFSILLLFDYLENFNILNILLKILHNVMSSENR